ncbi:MAG: uncharacterized protein JWO94_1795 [Verrucomicrobiaceae bacterium]|nr:uncharacterized protein [Verrucomicrobiaceae bacterium]
MPNSLIDVSLPVSLERRVHTLGHGLFKLSEAWRLLSVRLDRGMLDADATAWIKHWCGKSWSEPLTLPGDAAHQALIVWAGKAWQVEAVAGEELTMPWFALLMLLHLPALRAFWRRALRTQRFNWMTKALPRVWALDPQPLKPGTVIAGLGLADWAQLPVLMAKGRLFEVITPADGLARPVEEAGWAALLVRAQAQPLLLRERFSLEPEGQVRAFWHHNDAGRIVLGWHEMVPSAGS